MQFTEAQFFGTIFLLYGIWKLTIVILLATLPMRVQRRLARVPFVNLIFTGDRTTAGRGVDYILIAFAAFSLLHGLALWDAIPHVGIDRFIESASFHNAVYLACGAAVTVFYGIVVYTDVPIEKKPENRGMYMAYTFLLGPSFLLVPLIAALYARHPRWTAAFVTCAVIGALLIANSMSRASRDS